MADDELQQQLKRWGSATVARFAANDDGPSAGDHILAKNRDLAPGTREKADRQLVGRDGEDRRRYMAKAAGVSKLGILPTWAVDHVPCKNDADAPHDRTPEARVDLGIPDELRWVDRAMIQLSRENPLRALILREEFTGRGTQRMKAGRVERQYGGSLNLNQYRRELQRGLDWMRGKRAA